MNRRNFPGMIMTERGSCYRRRVAHADGPWYLQRDDDCAGYVESHLTSMPQIEPKSSS
jgi:hypothetical protein